jgi:hypothetical protein
VVAHDIIATGSADHPWLGVEGRDLPVAVAAEWGTVLPAQPVPGPGPGRGPLPPIKVCNLDFRDGCYVLTYRASGLTSFEGTLRVDRAAPDGGPDNIIVSGDLYTKPPVLNPSPVAGDTPAGGDEPRSVAAAASAVELAGAIPIPPLFRPRIPIFPRARYHSYLKVTSVSVPKIVLGSARCKVTLVVEQFNYTQPPAGQFKGSFPSTPSRTVTIELERKPAPFPFSLTGGPYFEGSLIEGGIDKGPVTLAWVSPFFRRATLEIDTLTGAVPPAPVPASGGGTEFFDTIYAKHGWQLTVVSDQTGIAVPTGVNPKDCWSSANLHALMLAQRNPATDLDKEWRVHMIVVPAKLGCGRGVMYDQIGVPREGCASFSNDGYPTSDSSNFGTAANQMQLNVPRAFLRSATHEVTHTFNQIHQEQETAADNSIMTTTPSVADVLGGPTTGAPGVFPDQINLAVNTTVRHHLNHMPDPVIRPGGWPFASWFGGNVPQASDRAHFAPSELELVVGCDAERLVLGQPLDLRWTMTNNSNQALYTPNDVSVEGLFASITVTDAEGRQEQVRPFVIACDTVKLAALAPGGSVSASTKLFWSSAGFAFERPGRYVVTVTVSWSASGVPVGLDGSVDVFVEYPTTDADNRAAALVLHPEVGKWVALGGGAYHLEEATRRLNELTGLAGGPEAARALAEPTAAGGAAPSGTPRLLAGFAGLLPDDGDRG